MLTATLVDDEPYCCETLSILLERYCPEIKILNTCYSAADALNSIALSRPDILFLDIEMPKMNGFEMLEKLPEINFALIFTTSYDQYALRAIRFSAIDYLLKPVIREELQSAVQKAVTRFQVTMPQQVEILMQKLRQPALRMSKVAIPTMEGLRMIAADAIISCGADGNYTVLHLRNKEKITASRTLKEIEEVLEEYSFARVHHSWLVNLNEIEKYIKGEGGYLVMSDSSVIDVSRSRKESLLKKLQGNKS